MESFLDRLLAESRAATRPPDDNVAAARGGSSTAAVPAAVDEPPPLTAPQGPGAPRIAVYDTLTSPPRIIAVEEKDLPALIASLAEKTYNSCREQGGQIPFTVIQELIENLLHASFCDVVVTVLDNGQTIRISDHGPGIEEKERAFLPGFTTATSAQRRFIRGVGSGLPIAREALQFLRGVLTVEDNLGGGAVVTIKLPSRPREEEAHREAPSVKLTTRQTKVLVLLMELGSAGPKAVARELGISPATAFRDLNLLEQKGLIHSLGDGKRGLREEGLRLLDSIV
ncbi:MAG TPA: ATP-binding protein [Thermoleophilia bacterium]|nr:ATP-binding protein [Thermoleophilia bacterium]HQG02753.1 ATP-binding protein [Thermoleophilia bacterium]HQJ97074.1 ATP-binding protein [Thermoleophilia bacterium]